MPVATGAYYRSVFLNLTLPGGVAGDVHRGVSHGREARDVGCALRVVAWERGAGQFVQIVLTVVVLLALPSPVRSSMPLVVAALVAAAVGVLVVDRARSSDRRSRWARAWSSCWTNVIRLRAAPPRPGAWPTAFARPWASRRCLRNPTPGPTRSTDLSDPEVIACRR